MKRTIKALTVLLVFVFLAFTLISCALEIPGLSANNPSNNSGENKPDGDPNDSKDGPEEETKEDCAHTWNTVTTEPTCQSKGYDTKTCTLCGQTEKCNEKSKTSHNYPEKYESDSVLHWQKCLSCDETNREEHNVDYDGFCMTCDAPVSATWGLTFEISDDGNYTTVTKYSGVSSKVYIPDTYEGIPVKYINDGVFKSKRLEKLIIGDNVVEIGDGLLSHCDTLTELVIGGGVKKVGYGAFEWCRHLKTVTIKEGATEIGENMFLFCYNLKSVTIPETITSIGSKAFDSCESLTSIIIPDAVTSIGDYAFTDCPQLESVTIGSGLKEIGFSVFGSCYRLTDLTIKNGISEIGECMFANCSRLKSVTIPESVTKINNSAFSSCNMLNSVTFGNNVTEIGAGAFKGCGLITIIIPDSVTTIGDGAFSGCGSLTSVNIPYGVNAINSYTFCYCYALTNITIPDSVITIGEYAFGECHSINSISIPDSVTSIDECAFLECERLTDISLSGNLISLGDGAFSKCYSLEYNEYDNAYYIGNQYNPYLILVKAKNTDITSCLLSENTKFIHSDAFRDCNKLSGVTIPDSIIDVGASAFFCCDKLSYISVDENNAIYKDIDGNLYSKDGKILLLYAVGKQDTRFAIPDGVTEIAEWAFGFSTNVTSVIFPESLTKINENAFYGCHKLEDKYYKGGEETVSKIYVDSYNDVLMYATPHYNYTEDTTGEDN